MKYELFDLLGETLIEIKEEGKPKLVGTLKEVIEYAYESYLEDYNKVEDLLSNKK